MRRQMLAIGLVVACASALGAISTSSASAGGWFYTCVPHAATPGKDNFLDKDCETVNNAVGEYGHVPYTEWTTWWPDLTANSILAGKLFGAAVEIQATGAECLECEIGNVEVGGVKEATGVGKIVFTGVTVVGSPACTVNSGTITTKKLKFTVTSPTGFTFEPETGTTFEEFNITGASCTVAGTSIKVTGKAFAAESGAKLTINVAKASEEMKLEGEKASFKCFITWTAGVFFSGVHHPIGFTTT